LVENNGFSIEKSKVPGCFQDKEQSVEKTVFFVKKTWILGKEF